MIVLIAARCSKGKRSPDAAVLFLASVSEPSANCFESAAGQFIKVLFLDLKVTGRLPEGFTGRFVFTGRVYRKVCFYGKGCRGPVMSCCGPQSKEQMCGITMSI